MLPIYHMPTTTITFGEVAENGPRMQQLGTIATDGFSPTDLEIAKTRFEEAGCDCELIDLVALSGLGATHGLAPACILIIRNGAEALYADHPILAPTEKKTEELDDLLAGLGEDPNFIASLVAAAKKGPPLLAADNLLAEQSRLVPDKKAIFRGVVKNKNARWNLTFGDTPQEPCYDEGKGRVVPFTELPRLAKVRSALPYFLGRKAVGLLAEMNLYYDNKVCGIGMHGDGERRRVVAIRLGDEMPLAYQWYLRSTPIGPLMRFTLRHGDCYVMSEKAVGTDWRRSSIPTLRHGAGASKYITPKRK